MALFKEQLEEILTYYKGLENLYMNDLANGPEGRLNHQMNRGYDEYLLSYSKEGTRIRRAITRNEELIRKLARKEFARKALEVLRPDIDLLERVVNGMIPFNLDEILGSMTNAYKLLPEEYFFDRNSTSIDLNLSDADKARIERHREWGEQSYVMNDYLQEYRNKRTSRGEFVRSKSELLIVERLYQYGIPKRYEEVVEKNGYVFSTDFSFEGGNGDEFFMEHYGLMDHPDYAKRNFKKMDRLYDAGVIPGDNLIMTFDRNGTIDMEVIDAVIRYEIIPRL